MNNIMLRLAAALRAGLTPTGSTKDMERVHAECVEALAAYDAMQSTSDESYKDHAYYVVATWNGAQQIWREGFFESEEEAAGAFGRYLKDFYVAAPGSPALNPEIRKLEV